MSGASEDFGDTALVRPRMSVWWDDDVFTKVLSCHIPSVAQGVRSIKHKPDKSPTDATSAQKPARCAGGSGAKAPGVQISALCAEKRMPGRGWCHATGGRFKKFV